MSEMPAGQFSTRTLLLQSHATDWLRYDVWIEAHVALKPLSVDGTFPDVHAASSVGFNAPSEMSAFELSTYNKLNGPSPV